MVFVSFIPWGLLSGEVFSVMNGFNVLSCVVPILFSK